MKNRATTATAFLLLLVFSLCVGSFAVPSLTDPIYGCKGWLVQSIPTDMPYLRPVKGVLSTADVFRWLAGNSTRRLDIIAQYWQLLAHPDDPQSGDYGYSKSSMKHFGADDGFTVYSAIESAADRRVNMRILQHSGFYPYYTNESSNLASGRPNVEVVTLQLDQWWGSGIVHAKAWISDRKDIYIGSANNDWKSLTQVKEVGIYIANCPKLAKKVEFYFNNLWALASLNYSLYTKEIWDQLWQIHRKVPCWSHFIQEPQQCRPPISHYVDIDHVVGYPPIFDPLMFHLQLETPGCTSTTKELYSSYLSFSPPELSFNKHQTDEQAWVNTIKSVGPGATLRISTMDWLGQSQYTKPTIYWPSLSSAISENLVLSLRTDEDNGYFVLGLRSPYASIWFRILSLHNGTRVKYLAIHLPSSVLILITSSSPSTQQSRY
uniref:PLD phosphodiesterase domain-containing protein n=1 Tax=Nelumbo nucifera TaxID=4432 RepID=A0A822ZLA1_NELNU|nr:TPA_asm: hypothetical protein HUJ06_003500 [Nelumbo nucifera]